MAEGELDAAGIIDRRLRRIAAVFYVVAACVALLVANTVLGQGYQRQALNLLTPFALLSILAIWYVPWQRYPRSLFAVPSFSSLALGALLVGWTGGWASPFANFTYFASVFAALYYRRTLAMLVGLAATSLVPAPLLFGYPLPDGDYTLIRLLLVAGTTHLAIVYVAGTMKDELARLYSESRARREFEARLTYHALHDALTGLPNRICFTEQLTHALARAARAGTRTAVLFLDLDRFKVINDSLGHSQGDQLLIAAAGRLRACLRGEDLVARLGGDEFTILLEAIADQAEAIAVAERITAALRQPFLLAGREVVVTTSIGIALSEAGREGADDLLRDADTAMYRAKQGGKAGYAVFDAGMNRAAMARLQLEMDLRRAVERGELVLHYQPKVELETGRIVGVEALARWRHPERGAVPPTTFIPLAEETGLVLPLGRWVLEEACRQTCAWLRRWPAAPPLALSVNLSARQFQQPGLVDEIAAVLRETGLPASYLQLEITESVVMDDVDTAIATLGALKGLGVRLALDDFGTGYSSLSYLKRFPLDMLKIDRTFVRGLGEDVEGTAIVGAVTSLAHILGMRVTAEGVETAGQAAYLRHLGCELAQGFYFAPPLPAAEFAARLAEQNALAPDERQQERGASPPPDRSTSQPPAAGKEAWPGGRRPYPVAVGAD